MKVHGPLHTPPQNDVIDIWAAYHGPGRPSRHRSQLDTQTVMGGFFKSIPPHTFFVLSPVGHRPRSPPTPRPARFARAPSRHALFLPRRGFAFALVDGARRGGANSRKKEPDLAMVAHEIDALLTCMGPMRRLAIGWAAGRPENVGDVLRGVGRKKCVAGTLVSFAPLGALAGYVQRKSACRR